METSLTDTFIPLFQNCYMDRKIMWHLIKSSVCKDQPLCLRNGRKALSTLTDVWLQNLVDQLLKFQGLQRKVCVFAVLVVVLAVSTLFLLLLLLLLCCCCCCFVFQLSHTTFSRTNVRVRKVVKRANSHLSSQH